MLTLGSASPGTKPPTHGVEVPAGRPRRGRRGVGRVDHDVDPDRRLLRLDELRQPEPVGRVRRQQVHGRVREARRGDELLRVRRVVRRARDLRRVVPGGVRRRDRGAARLASRPPKTTLFSVLRSIASSNACRSFALEASGVPTFVYGRLPTPFLLPMLMKMPCQPSWGAWITRRLEVCWTAGSSVVETLIERLDVARLQRRRRGGRVGHRLEDDLVEVDVLLVVVVGRLDQGDVVADDAVVEHERADADRVASRSCRRAWPAASARGRTGCRR